MSREAHVQFCEGLAGKFRWSTLLVVCFQSGKEAEEFSKALKERLGRYGLKTSENKSKIIEFGRYAWQKAKEREESDTIKTKVEGIKDEVDRTLPILWDKREYANNEAVL